MPGIRDRQPESQSAVRTFFETTVEAADGDIHEATRSIEELPAALAYIYGYSDKLAEDGDAARQEAYKLAIAHIGNQIVKDAAGDAVAQSVQWNFWKPAFDAVELREEMGSKWPKILATTNLFEQAGDQFLRGF